MKANLFDKITKKNYWKVNLHRIIKKILYKFFPDLLEEIIDDYLQEIARIYLDINKCGDCKCEPQYYMVKDELWEKYGNGEGLLCLSCLEKRMNRKLTIEDFTDCRVNQLIFWTYDYFKDNNCDK